MCLNWKRESSVVSPSPLLGIWNSNYPFGSNAISIFSSLKFVFCSAWQQKKLRTSEIELNLLKQDYLKVFHAQVVKTNSGAQVDWRRTEKSERSENKNGLKTKLFVDDDERNKTKRRELKWNLSLINKGGSQQKERHWKWNEHRKSNVLFKLHTKFISFKNPSLRTDRPVSLRFGGKKVQTESVKRKNRKKSLV